MKTKNGFPPRDFLILHCFIYFFIIVTVDCSHSASLAQREDVYIAGFFPYKEGAEKSDTGRGVMPSVKIALDHVNEHSIILRKYRLHMWWNDTECKAAVGIKSFFDMMHSGPHKLMLFGAACTHVTDPIAKASKHWHLTQLSYADTHPMFTKDAFPNFFRIVPSENAFNAPRLALLKEFNWTRVGTIYQNEPRYALPHNHMVAELDGMGCDIVETTSFVDDVSESLAKLREKDVRIILGNFNESYARKVFCEAYRIDMFGRAYQWLIMGSYSQYWWNSSDIDCDLNELEKSLESVIIADLLPLSTSGDITVSGITADEYMKEYNSRRGSEYSIFHGYTYDGIWAVAMAIQHVAQHRPSFAQNFRYRIKEWENIFVEALQNTSFEGVTGPVRFYNNERKASFLLKQFQFGQWMKIGEFNSLLNRLDLSLGSPIKWVGRYPPKDRTLRIIEHGQVNLTIYAILASCSVLGIILATIFLAINIRYRNQRYIKMSSPHLNNLIIVGCILTYLSVIFLGLDSGLSSIEAFPYICTTRAWLLMAGFSLAFGAMFSKTWRVHSIFTDVKLNKKVIKDYQLFMVVGVLLAIDLAIMLSWQIADPFFRDTKQMEPFAHPHQEDVIIVQENEYCKSKHITIFFSVIYAYKGLLLVFGAFLAWETRNVSIPALNDSKHVGLSVYNVTMMCIMGVAIALIISDRKDAVFILISVFIIFCTTATLCLVFVPKIVELRRNPTGAVDKKTRATLRPMSKNRRDSSVCELEQRMREVRSNNNRFKKALIEKERELQALIGKLGPDARKWIDNNLAETEPLHDPSKLTVPGSSRQDLSSVAGKNNHHLPSSMKTITATIGARSINYDDLPTEISCIDTTDMTSVGSSRDDMEKSGQKTPEQKKKRVTLLSDEPSLATSSSNKELILSKSNSQTSSLLIKNMLQSTNTSTFAHAQKLEPTYALPHYNKQDLKAALVEKYSESQYQNVPNDFLLKRKNSVDANTMTNWVQNGIPDVDDRTSRNLTKFNTEINTNSMNASSMTHSNTELNVCPHGKGSTKAINTEQYRRVSVQIGSNAAAKGNFVVSQSDLWDTHTLQQAKQRSCTSPRNQKRDYICSDHHSGPGISSAQVAHSPVSVGSPHSETKSVGPMQRSVSEKNRPKHRHKQKAQVCQSETDSERERETVTCNQTRKLTKGQHSHHHSTPNVAPDKHKHSRLKKDSTSSMYGACSETELLEGDTAILPIFQKLLTERENRHRHRNMVGASCPNISIKCDIVEYL